MLFSYVFLGAVKCTLFLLNLFMAKLYLIVRTRFIREQTDLSKCAGCEDVIYSDMYVLWIKIRNEKPQKTDVCICESCNEIMKNR